jgi:hypothetical protein
MERLLNNVSRFATLLTRTPTPHDRINQQADRSPSEGSSKEVINHF